jgi:hypothetical protein
MRNGTAGEDRVARSESGGKEKPIAVVKVRTEGKGGKKGAAGREGAVVVMRGKWKGTRKKLDMR